jgi:hypothetical protein
MLANEQVADGEGGAGGEQGTSLRSPVTGMTASAPPLPRAARSRSRILTHHSHSDR